MWSDCKLPLLLFGGDSNSKLLAAELNDILSNKHLDVARPSEAEFLGPCVNLGEKLLLAREADSSSHIVVPFSVVIAFIKGALNSTAKRNVQTLYHNATIYFSMYENNPLQPYTYLYSSSVETIDI